MAEKEKVEQKMTVEELERFKKNLRKSVIISFVGPKEV